MSLDATVKWHQLDQMGDELINYANKDISGQITLIKEKQKEATWEGADSERAMQQFSNAMDEMQKVATAIAGYGRHLKDVAAGYRGTSTAVEQVW